MGGGSYVEDMLGIILQYSVVVCFAVIVPKLVLFALLANLVQYRLLLCRMALITSRPFPVDAQGIGTWDKILKFIAMIAAIVGVLNVSQMRTVMSSWDIRDLRTFY